MACLAAYMTGDDEMNMYYAVATDGFGLWTSPDFKTWMSVTNAECPFYNDKVEFPPRIRHGSIIPLTQAELDKPMETYGNNR